MNKLVALTISLATTLPAGAALAGQDPPSGELVWSDAALKELFDVSFRPEYATGAGQFLPMDELDPGVKCTSGINASADFNMALYEQSVLGIPFTVGVAAGVGLVADATKMGAQASLGPTIKFGGLKFHGQDTVKPIELVFEAATHAGGGNTVSARLLGFGFTIDTIEIASTPSPIFAYELYGYDLPMGDFTGAWNGTADCGFAGVDCTLEGSFSYALSARLAGLFRFQVNAATGVRSIALGSVVAYAHATGSAGVDVEGVSYSNSATATFNLINTTFAARGNLKQRPSDGKWVADAAATISVDDAMGGALTFEFDVPDSIPLVPEVITWTPWSLTETTYWNEWEYQCTFPRLLE